MASKLNPNVLYVAEPGELLGSTQVDSERTHLAGEAGEESSDSDGEQEETSHKLIRKVSTSGQIRAKVGQKKKEERKRERERACVEVGPESPPCFMHQTGSK
ncbi:hypothetical protein LDENG_00152610 [Lucifuga dentata]|nr:hypothetical protein LDENG_00152610 [Lucifuga dentata]